MKQRSSIFNAGQRIAGTMLTIVDSMQPNSWQEVLCRCDCGRQVVLPYLRVYFKQYSCGCKRKLRFDAVDHTGFCAVSKAGNQNEGRSLTVLYRDPETMEWQYVCSCCAQVYTVPRGAERGLQSTLLRTASQVCANFAGHFTPVERCDRLLSMVHSPGSDGGHRKRNAERILAPCYPPERVKRNMDGEIEGFYGEPKIPEKWRKELERRRKARKKLKAIAGPISTDPDGFNQRELTVWEVLPPVVDIVESTAAEAAD